MTMWFAASDTHRITYVVSGNRMKAEAWIRRQAQPARYRAISPSPSCLLGLDEVVVLPSTLTDEELAEVKAAAMFEGTTIREVYA